MSIKKSAAALGVALGVGVGAVTGAASASAAPVASPPATVLFAPVPENWVGDTGQFAFCLGGFGVAAVPVVTAFFFYGPIAAGKAAKEWFPRLGPIGTSTLKSCMWSVLHVRV